jgi:hypothetical protein
VTTCGHHTDRQVLLLTSTVLGGDPCEAHMGGGKLYNELWQTNTNSHQLPIVFLSDERSLVIEVNRESSPRYYVKFARPHHDSILCVSKLQSAQDSLYNLICFALAPEIRREKPSLSVQHDSTVVSTWSAAS